MLKKRFCARAKTKLLETYIGCSSLWQYWKEPSKYENIHLFALSVVLKDDVSSGIKDVGKTRLPSSLGRPWMTAYFIIRNILASIRNKSPSKLSALLTHRYFFHLFVRSAFRLVIPSAQWPPCVLHAKTSITQMSLFWPVYPLPTTQPSLLNVSPSSSYDFYPILLALYFFSQSVWWYILPLI